MIVDFHDLGAENHRLDLLWKLREANPEFRCTAFAVPANGTPDFWESVPGFIELAVHGWQHLDSYECAAWDYDRMLELVELVHDDYPWFTNGFCAPGWQISDACYQVLLDEHWWVADHPVNNERRPPDLPAYVLTHPGLGDSEEWHGHIQDVCGNGIEETWDVLLPLVRGATEFKWVSEVVK